MDTGVNSKRMVRLRKKINRLVVSEYEAQFKKIRDRADYISQLEPFLEVLQLSLHPEEIRERVTGEVVLSLCVQAPQELFYAAGIRNFRLACGSFAAQQLTAGQLPPLTCPMIRSISGMLNCRDKEKITSYKAVIPTTCDWVVKAPELLGMGQDECFFMELPHLREQEKASERWLEEVYGLKKWLEQLTGRKITRKVLRHAINTYNKAHELFTQLVEMRRRQRLPMIHFAVIANAMIYDDIQQWMGHLENYLEQLPAPAERSVPVFFAGSPLHFPNYKMLQLIEDAGMTIAADDVCSLERILPGSTCYEDTSEYGLLRALAEKNHRASVLPLVITRDA